MNRAIYFVIIILAISLASCEKSYFMDGGLSLELANNTENVYHKASLYLGAVKGNDFVVTDSIVFNGLIDARISTSRANGVSIAYDWKPDIDAVKSQSNNGIFLFRLSDGRQLFLYPFSFPNPIFNEVILHVFIEEHGLVNYEDPNGEIKQDFNIIK